MSRLLIVSNRLSVSVAKRGGGVIFRPSTGGLATGLASLAKFYERLWIGWPGISSEKLSPAARDQACRRLAEQNCYPVFFSDKEIDAYYDGFCNKTIWPLFHYFPLRTRYEDRYWRAYEQANEAFCEVVLQATQPGDRIWIHDYQLMLLPQLIRRKLPTAQIGFFLHIPFPSFELFRLLPWRNELIDGILGADLIGFHTYDYVRHFLSSICRIAGIEHTLGRLTVGNRLVKVDAFPMGIDYQKYSQAVQKPEVQKELSTLRDQVGDRKIILSIDRLDYSKGIIQRLEAFDLFLSQNPQYKGKVTLILLAVPSRTNVEDYRTLRRRLESLVGRVNGEHGSLGWVPVWYLYREVSFERLVALYNLADVALLTPLRDGMNLISKEFVAAKADGRGVLILSEMAGAASELGEAMIVNAHHKGGIVKAIKEALEMSSDERAHRNKLMQKRLSRYDFSRWAGDFLNSLTDLEHIQQGLSVRKLAESSRAKLLDSYRASHKRLLLLDYDGTLVGFVGRPERAKPDEELLATLRTLAEGSANELVVISGRGKNILSEWLGNLKISLVAEHGAWIREKGQDWLATEPLRTDWKDVIRPILELYVDRTPGSFVEEKDFSLVWHCRRTAPELASVRTQELRDAVLNLIENLDVGVFEGSDILEVKAVGINKGRATETWLSKQKWDFILAVGDDYTDEDMFAVLTGQAYSIKVGPSISSARFNVDSVADVRLLLKDLARSSDVKR
ncbi:MAG: bifunctional alpha,alpha-trehalose-phosphate synthase (UDP-forming)/trehalose-phosphatase [Actinobacteria bacterium]|nr:bifunctional alpha,alpha-trehalose-phosphate synthase (UDP-forming)/trehalose-phosphatase [Actinomycetota bacterium]